MVVSLIYLEQQLKIKNSWKTIYFFQLYLLIMLKMYSNNVQKKTYPSSLYIHMPNRKEQKNLHDIQHRTNRRWEGNKELTSSLHI